MIRMIRLLLDNWLFAHHKREISIRRQSLLLQHAEPVHCQHDTAKHRRYHHYYEDLLT